MALRKWVLAATASLLLIGCGGGGGGGSDSGDNGTGNTAEQTIQTTQQAESVYAGASEAIFTYATGLTGIAGVDTNAAPQILALQQVDLASKLSTAASPRQTYNSTQSCTGGGSVSSNINTTNSSVYNATITYNQCTQGGSTLNGKIVLKDFDYSSNNYSASISFQNLTMTASGMTAFYDIDISYNVNGNDVAMALDGTMNIDIPAQGLSADFQYDHFEIAYDGTDLTMAINGGLTVDFTPDRCGDGSYDITTVVPLKQSAYDNTLTAGKIIINGATYEFHSNGTVTITVNGSSVTKSQSSLQTSCS